ncbi:MAG: sugar kinase [Actinobacteria bacterium]|jgi:sugar/nucleoside kinase (ribokinase family)|nr:sugar kinase [Actinomycetota bacterium]
MTNNSKILCIGDIMLDVTAVIGKPIVEGLETRASISTFGGGAAANVASWLVAANTPSYLITRVGDDAAGKAVLDQLDQLGVAHSDKVVPGKNTGVVIVIVGNDGERTMFPDSGANAGLGVADLPELSEFSAVYLSGYPLINPQSNPGVLEIVEVLRRAKLPIIFDPATVGVLLEVGVAKVRQWLELIDVVVLNEEEAQFITGFANPVDAAGDLLKIVPTVVIKRGSNGALAQTRDGSLIQIPALPTTVVNTTGAGDAFAAGFISIWAQDGQLNDALEAGAKLAAECVALIGARPLVAPN